MNDRTLLRIATTTGVLTARQWEALALVLVEDLTYREAGERMNIGERAAARLVDRALRRIRQHAEHGRPKSTQTVEAHGPMAA